MRILFTNSPLHYTHGHTFTQPDWQTLVLPTLAGIVGDGHSIRLVDNTSQWFRSNRIMEVIRNFDPDVVGFSIIAARDIHNTVRVIRRVKEVFPSLVLIAGGQGASAYADLLLESGMHHVVKGEGERAIPLLLSDLHEKCVYDCGQIENLDDSPFPVWHLMPKRKSRWFKGRFTGSLEMSRGCPFKCNFCAIASFWGGYRAKSNERILEEMESLVLQQRSHIYLADDNFGTGVGKHMELFDEILGRELDIRFFAQIRTDTVAENPDMIAMAARAGLYGVLVGFDAYDRDTFHHVAKRGSIELNNECARILRENRIMIFGSHIYGLPSQRRPRDFSRTFWMGRRNSDLFRMPHLSLLPGTEYYGRMVNDRMIGLAMEGKDDFRLLIRDKKEQRRFKRWYSLYNLLNVFLPDEVFKAFFHANKNVRILKRMGYWGMLRHWFYKHARKIGLVDV